jgi:hypothetical protein
MRVNTATSTSAAEAFMQRQILQLLVHDINRASKTSEYATILNYEDNQRLLEYVRMLRTAPERLEDASDESGLAHSTQIQLTGDVHVQLSRADLNPEHNDGRTILAVRNIILVLHTRTIHSIRQSSKQHVLWARRQERYVTAPSTCPSLNKPTAPST